LGTFERDFGKGFGGIEKIFVGFVRGRD